MSCSIHMEKRLLISGENLATIFQISDVTAHVRHVIIIVVRFTRFKSGVCFHPALCYYEY